MWVNERYIDQLKKFLSNENEIDHFLEFCQMPLKKSIKINLNKISTRDFIEITSKRWWKLTKPDFEFEDKTETDLFYIDRENLEIPLGKTFLHQSWFFYIQEIAAGMSVKFLDIVENWLVLDISAAPWGKTTQIWDYLMMKNRNKPGLVVSNDVNKTRILALAHNISRMWIYNNIITSFNWFSFGKNLGEIFDAVLVDAPCSGEWTGFKSDFALSAWRIEEIKKIAGTQFQLLVSAIKATKPWGNIIFSTCTLNPIENEWNLKKILDFFGSSVELVNIEIKNKSSWIWYYNDEQILNSEDTQKVARFWPHIQKTWWFFISKIVKKDTTEKLVSKESRLYPKNPFKIDFSNSLQKKILNYLSQEFGIKTIETAHFFVSTRNQVYLVSPKFLEIKDLMHIERIWIPILKTYEDGKLLPLHGLGSILGNTASKNFVELDEIISQKYALWEEISLDEVSWWKYNSSSEFVVLKRNGYGLGVGKIVNWMIRNKYIK